MYSGCVVLDYLYQNVLNNSDEKIKWICILCRFFTLRKTVVRIVEILPCGQGTVKPKESVPYGLRWPDNNSSQCINSCGIGLVHQKNSSHGKRIVNMTHFGQTIVVRHMRRASLTCAAHRITIVSSVPDPANTRCSNNVTIASKLRHDVVLPY